MAWANVILFGTAAGVFLWRIFDAHPRIEIDDSGILDHTLGIGRIPWAEIQDAYLQSIQGNAFVCLTVRGPKLFLQDLSPLGQMMMTGSRALGFREVNLNLSGVAANRRKILELIRARVRNQTI